MYKQHTSVVAPSDNHVHMPVRCHNIAGTIIRYFTTFRIHPAKQLKIFAWNCGRFEYIPGVAVPILKNLIRDITYKSAAIQPVMNLIPGFVLIIGAVILTKELIPSCADTEGHCFYPCRRIRFVPCPAPDIKASSDRFHSSF